MIRLATKTYAVAGVGLGLCVLLGFAVRFPTSQELPTETPSFRSRADSPVAVASEPELLRTTLPVAQQPPSPGPAPDRATAPAGAGTGLPPPPSGDYELDLDAGQISALVERRYGELFRSVNLSPARLARLRSLLAERQQASVDAANAALLTGLNPIRDLPTIRAAIEQAKADADGAIRTELGERIFASVSEYDHTLSERNSVAEFARLLAAINQPLQPEQEQRMFQIMKNQSRAAAPADLDRAIFGDMSSLAPISEETVAEAAPMLSPQQRELLRQLHQRGSPTDARR